MPKNILVKDSDKYSGQYVATKSFKDKKVLSFGENPTKVFTEAKKKGAKDPVIVYIPEKDMVHIYGSSGFPVESILDVIPACPESFL